MADNVIVRVPEQQFIRGEDGYSPEVTIEDIAHGHSVNITDREHPEGQSFDVLDGASAYEQAVAGGYTGTEAQFNEDLTNFKTLHDETEEVAPFYAEYGVTTKAEIAAAINGKRQIYAYQSLSPYSPILPYVGKIHYADEHGSGTGYRFALTEGRYLTIFELMSSWNYRSVDLEAPAQRAEAAADQALNRMNSADQSAQSAAGSASNASRDAGTASTAATTATAKAGEASDSATAADDSAKDAEAYAIGKRGGTDVGSTDSAYHNNAKYYAEQAASSASDAVTAKGAAETAQGKAEDAQEAAEAVLESIPADYTTLSGDVDDLKSAFDGVLEQDGNITYAETPITIASTSQFPQFERNGNIFCVNGTFTGTRVLFRLSKSRFVDGNRTASVNTARGWDKTVPIKAGHKYKGILTLLSGNYTASNYIAVACFNTLSSDAVAFYPNTPKIMELNDTNCSVTFRIEGGATFTNAVFMFTLVDVTDETALASPAINIAYSWWTNNSVTDSYGVLYFGYIGKNAMCGVGCRYPNGKVCTKDIFQSEDCDDHNAPSVILVNIDGAEYVCVIGSTGHNTDNKINCYLAAKPNTILCEFVNKTYAIPEPTGYKFQCSYSQAFYDATNSAIYNFFRIKQINNSDNSNYMVWMVAISSNNGDSWDVYRVFATGVQSELFYMQSTPSGSSYIKGMVLQTNTTNPNVRPIRNGYINLRSKNIIHGTGSGVIGTISLLSPGELAYSADIGITNYNDFDAVVPTTGIDENGFLTDQYRYRILDAIYDASHFLYVKSLENVSDTHNVTDWILYRYSNGVVTEISHLGLAFFVGSAYATGACFVGNSDTVVYSKNDSNTQDGAHSLHRVKISNDVILADDVIKRSSMTIARPHRYDNGSFFALIGKYLEGTGTRYLTWHFSMAFFDFLP